MTANHIPRRVVLSYSVDLFEDLAVELWDIYSFYIFMKFKCVCYSVQFKIYRQDWFTISSFETQLWKELAYRLWT